MISSMPKMESVSRAPHRSSISTASAAGGNVRSSPWSTKDDETLIQARAAGLNWNQISPKHFPGKTPNACRKRHERLMERQNNEQWDGGVKFDVLAQAYMDVREQMWRILAERVGEKWQVVEQKCLEKGLKNLNQASRSAQKKKGSYDDHGDSGICISDMEEDDHVSELAPAPFKYHAEPRSQQRVPSIPIQSIMNYSSGPNLPAFPQQHHQLAQ